MDVNYIKKVESYIFNAQKIYRVEALNGDIIDVPECEDNRHYKLVLEWLEKNGEDK